MCSRIYIYIYFCKTGKTLYDVFVNKFYYYNYNTTKIFDDPVAFLSGTMRQGRRKSWLCYDCNNKIC